MKKNVLAVVCMSFFCVFAQQAASNHVLRPGESYRLTIGQAGEQELASAQGWSPVALSLVDGVSVPRETYDVYGLRLNLLMGTHRDVVGLDVGLLANTVLAEEQGISLAGVWTNIGRSSGAFVAAGAFNVVEENFRGVQLALGYNTVRQSCKGVQVAVVNEAATMNGVQVGVVNVADHGRGLQLGLVNYVQGASGLQIGLLNVIENSRAPYLPVLNFAF